MSNAIFNALSNLKAFNFESDFKNILLNQHWVLVNGINKKKAIYIFKTENRLHILEHKTTSKTKWNIIKENTFSITTQDGITTVKAYFKDNNILILNKIESDDCAVFINESSYSNTLNTLNSLDDVQQFLHNKYKNKASDLILEHQFYYIEKSKEFGPFSAKELIDKANNKRISIHCFIRDANANDYSKKLRVKDLIAL